MKVRSGRRGRMDRFAGNVMGQVTAFGTVSIGGYEVHV